MPEFSSGWFGYRQVVESPGVSSELTAAEAIYPRLREIWDDGVLWLLGQGADKFGSPSVKFADTRLHVFAGDGEAGIPDIWLIYRLTENTVEALHVNFVAHDGA